MDLRTAAALDHDTCITSTWNVGLGSYWFTAVLSPQVDSKTTVNNISPLEVLQAKGYNYCIATLVTDRELS